MSKKIEDQILAKIESGEIQMKPRWYFVMGSALLFGGLVGVSILVMFLLNLLIFTLRRNPQFLYSNKFDQIITQFPWWIPLLAIMGIIVAVVLLRKYDFSYRNNFKVIFLAFIASVILAAVIVDASGINESLSRGKMKRFYQQIYATSGHDVIPQRGDLRRK